MTMKKFATRSVVLLLIATLVCVGGLPVHQSVSLAAGPASDLGATPLANADPTPGESALLARVKELEASLAQEKAVSDSLRAELNQEQDENKSLSAKLDQQVVTNARLAAALEIATRVSETKDQQIEKQSKRIQDQLETIADLTEQRTEINQALIKERSEHRRAKDSLLRVTENLKACQAERDRLAAELAELQENDE